MNTKSNAITLPGGDVNILNDFEAGNSVQIRVTIEPDEQPEYEKGKTIEVSGKSTSMAKIVSDPIVINEKLEDGRRELSLIVEKV